MGTLKPTGWTIIVFMEGGYAVLEVSGNSDGFALVGWMGMYIVGGIVVVCGV